MTGKQRLWTRDFTIITLGSAISMLGNAMTGFALSLFVLDYSDTPFLYALFIFLYTLPQIAAPVLSGPLMDRLSRRRTIYLLDFTSAGLYALVGLLLHLGRFSFPLLAGAAFLVGTIHSVYLVAFNSFYPLLIPEGLYSKAYSISSTLETLTFVVLPIATLLYNAFGMVPLLLGNSLCFLTAALAETRIGDVEALSPPPSQDRYTLHTYLEDSKEGLRYLREEKGLMGISAYYFFNFMLSGASSVITLPWFRQSFSGGEFVYMSVWGFGLLGRVAGGLLHYRLTFPPHRRFSIALFLSVLTGLLEAGYLYAPLPAMRCICLVMGLASMTTYNFRVSTVQSYVPNHKKGRFNGIFLMLTTLGSLAGELLAGFLLLALPMRAALAVFGVAAALAALLFLGGSGKHIRPIYDREV